MNIGEAASRSGLPTKTIRYYETIGLVSSTRRANGFRDYGEEAVRKLSFIGCARSLGFTVEDCRALVDLFEDRSRPPSQTAALIGEHVDSIRKKVAALRALETALTNVTGRTRRTDSIPSLDL